METGLKDYNKKGFYRCRPCHGEVYKRYRRNHPFKAKASYSNKRYNSSLTEEDVRTIFYANNGECSLCGEILEPNGTWHIDHKIPRIKGGDSLVSNLQALCAMCNIGKHKWDQDEYVSHCEKVAAMWKNQKRGK